MLSKLARGWSKSRRLARTARDLFPFTLPGVLLLGAAALALERWGLGRLDLVLIAASLLGGGLTLLLGATVAATAALLRSRLRRQRSFQAVATDCGVALPTGFVLPLPPRLPLVAASWTWVEPDAVEVVAVTARDGRGEVVTAARRGRAERVVRRITVADPTGLAAVSFTLAAPTEVRFAPRCGALAHLAVLDGLVAGDDLSDPRGSPLGDPIDMRRYAHGDSPRLILWKIYARGRKLLVRVPERAVAARTRTCAYLVSGRGDEPTAALARAAVEHGLLGEGWRFGADGTTALAHDPAEALEAMIASGRADPGAASALPSFLRRAEHDGFALCLVFVPPAPGPWLDPVVEALLASGLRTVVLTAVDGLPASPTRPSRLQRLLLLPAAGPELEARELDEVARRFVGLRSRMVAVDRSSGRLLGDPRLGVLSSTQGGRR